MEIICFKMETFFKKIVKILLYVFNGILLVYGLFLLACGLMITTDMRSYSHFLESRMFWPPYFIIFNGLMMALLALLGFRATYTKNYKLLVTFAISALIVLLAEIAIVTSISTETPRYAENIKLSLRRSFSNYSYTEVDRKAWDYMQRNLECCGIESPQDWSAIYAKNQVPASCCLIAPDQPGVLCRNTVDSEIVHQYGCHQILFIRLTDHWSVVSLLAAIAALVQVIVLVLSVVMAFLVKREKIARERQ